MAMPQAEDRCIEFEEDEISKKTLIGYSILAAIPFIVLYEASKSGTQGMLHFINILSTKWLIGFVAAGTIMTIVCVILFIYRKRR